MLKLLCRLYVCVSVSYLFAQIVAFAFRVVKLIVLCLQGIFTWLLFTSVIFLHCRYMLEPTMSSLRP